MGFYFCGRYIYTDGNPKQVEHDMYEGVLNFHGFDDRCGYEDY